MTRANKKKPCRQIYCMLACFVSMMKIESNMSFGQHAGKLVTADNAFITCRVPKCDQCEYSTVDRQPTAEH